MLLGRCDLGKILDGFERRKFIYIVFFRTWSLFNRQPHSLAGNAVETWRFVQVGSVASKIGPTHIVSENENDIRSVCCDDESARQKTENQNVESPHLSNSNAVVRFRRRHVLSFRCS
jgi:hypothetical protein